MGGSADGELLGTVTIPSGVLVVIDVGMLWIWERSHLEDLPDTVDFRIDGADAEAAGRRFEQSSHPRYWYDVPRARADEARRYFADFAAAEGLAAEVVEIAGGVPQRRRIDLALEHGGRFGTLEFFGVRAPVVPVAAPVRELAVHGVRMADDRLAERWRWVTVELRDGETTRSEEVGVVAANHGRLMVADADALERWRHEEPLDGRADLVFFGRDAAAAAARHGAHEVAAGEYGWLDLPVDEAVERGRAVEESRAANGWTFAGNFRPHSHNYEVVRRMRSSPTGAGMIEVGGATMCAFSTSWGGGVFRVLADTGRDGELLRLRIDLASDAATDRLRQAADL